MRSKDNNTFIFTIEPTRYPNYMHGAWQRQMVAKGLVCSDCRALKYPASPDLYADRIEPIGDQVFWNVGIRLIDSNLWKRLSGQIPKGITCKVFSPTKRISEPFRQAKEFRKELFTPRPDFTGVYVDPTVETVRIYEATPGKRKTKFICRTCGAINYPVHVPAAYVLKDDWKNRKCMMLVDKTLLISPAFAESIDIHSLPPVKLRRIALLDEHPRDKSEKRG